jgi:hypothetical protein
LFQASPVFRKQARTVGVCMSADILAFPTPAPKDGGKARIQARRGIIGLSANTVVADELHMGHADPEDTAPCEYSAPDQDMA